MQYVTVTANNHADALKKLRDQYGPDAIIYSEKAISPKSVFSQIVGKKQFQIEAALREKAPKNSLENPLSSHKIKDPKDSLHSLNTEKQSMIEMIQQSRLSGKFGQSPISSGSFNANSHPSSNSSSSDSLENWKPDQIELLRQFISKMAVQSEQAVHLYPLELQSLYSLLKLQDFTHNWVDTLLQAIMNDLPKSQWQIFPVLYKKATDLICDQIKTSSLFHKRAVAFIGPTGVGKTTTLAKIAAWLKLKKNQSISLITLDNYRLAATEQLKVYADILDVPVYVGKDPKKISQIFTDDNADIFLIDTAGLSHKNNGLLMKQNELFDQIEYDIEKHLILGANAKPEDTREIVTAFSYIGFDRIIISKVDETNCFGHLVELASKWKKPFSFFTIGQKVPNDYIPADGRYLADKILKNWKDID